MVCGRCGLSWKIIPHLLNFWATAIPLQIPTRNVGTLFERSATGKALLSSMLLLIYGLSNVFHSILRSHCYIFPTTQHHSIMHYMCPRNVFHITVRYQLQMKVERGACAMSGRSGSDIIRLCLPTRGRAAAAVFSHYGNQIITSVSGYDDPILIRLFLLLRIFRVRLI